MAPFLWAEKKMTEETGAASATPSPVYEAKDGKDIFLKPLPWDCAAGFRADVTLEFRGHSLQERRPVFEMKTLDARGKKSTLGLTFRPDGYLYFYINPGKPDTYIISACFRGSKIWAPGETHLISCGWDQEGNFKIFADEKSVVSNWKTGRPESVKKPDYMPQKITGCSPCSAAGVVKEMAVRLSPAGLASRSNPSGRFPMKISAPDEHFFLVPEVGLPLNAFFGITDSNLYQKAFPRIVLECPDGVAPFPEASLGRLYFGPVSYYSWRGGIETVKHDGKVYRRYTFPIPGTKPGYSDPKLTYPCSFTLNTILPPGKIAPIFLYAAWEGGQQPPIPLQTVVLPLETENFRFEKIPAGLWGVGAAPDIRAYCRKLGINFVTPRVEEADMDGIAPVALVLREMQNRLGADIDIDLISERIWWKYKLGHKWPAEIAFTRIDGAKDEKYPCMSYRGPEWFADRDFAGEIIRKGFKGICTDLESPVYEGCFCDRCCAGFKKYLQEHYKNLAYRDPREFEKSYETQTQFSDLHAAWLAYHGFLWSEYYLALCDGMAAAAKEMGLRQKPRLTIYNDPRVGRAGADLSHLIATPNTNVTVLLGPQFYCPPPSAGDMARKAMKKYPGAFLAPHIGRVDDEFNFEHYVYEIFANGARGFILFTRAWINGREFQTLSRGLRTIKKAEDLISRARPLDQPFDTDGLRIRAVGDGDEMLILVAQYGKKFKKKVSFSVQASCPMQVVNLADDRLMGTVSPENGVVTVTFPEPGAFLLHIKPAQKRN